MSRLKVRGRLAGPPAPPAPAATHSSDNHREANGAFLESIARWQVAGQLDSAGSLDSRLVSLVGFDLAAAYFVLPTATGEWRALVLIPLTLLGESVVVAVVGMTARFWKVGPDLTSSVKIAEAISAPTVDVQTAALHSYARAFVNNQDRIARKAHRFALSAVLTLSGVFVAGALSLTAFAGGSPRQTTTAPTTRAAVSPIPSLIPSSSLGHPSPSP